MEKCFSAKTGHVYFSIIENSRNGVKIRKRMRQNFKISYHDSRILLREEAMRLERTIVIAFIKHTR